MARLQRRKENVADLSPAVKLLNFLSLERLCRNTRNLIDVMLSKAKHLAFSAVTKSRFFGQGLIYESFVKWVIHSLIFVNVFQHTFTSRP